MNVAGRVLANELSQYIVLLSNGGRVNASIVVLSGSLT